MKEKVREVAREWRRENDLQKTKVGEMDDEKRVS